MIEWVILIIVIEAVTEIITSADITNNLRCWLTRKADTNRLAAFANKIVACGYCCSVWVSAAIAWIAPGSFLACPFIDYLIKAFALHRLSNMFHELTKRWLDRIPFVILVQQVEEQTEQSEVLGDPS